VWHSLPTIEEIEESDAEETGWQISKENSDSSSKKAEE
jgi:hypothetical protein